MSWLFSQALVEEYLGASSLDGEQSAPLSGKSIPQAYCSPDKMTEVSRLSRYGMTFAPLTENRGKELLTLFLEAFRAKTSQQPEKALELTERDRECGEKWLGSFTKYDPATSSWKTAQCSLLGDLEQFLETWPRWGLMRDGECLEQKMSERLMSAKDFGLLRKERLDKQHSETNTMDGYASGAGLALWMDANATTANGSASIAESGLHQFIMRNGTVALTAAPSMWLTPQANEDAAGTPNGKMQKMLSNHPLIRGPSKKEWDAGTMNPTWVEWLMGWPLGWTDLKPLGTDKYPSALPQPGEL